MRFLKLLVVLVFLSGFNSYAAFKNKKCNESLNPLVHDVAESEGLAIGLVEILAQYKPEGKDQKTVLGLNSPAPNLALCKQIAILNVNRGVRPWKNGPSYKDRLLAAEGKCLQTLHNIDYFGK